MIAINDTLSKGLAKRVIRDMTVCDYTKKTFNHLRRRKRIRETIKYIEKHMFAVNLGSRNKDTPKWEMLYGSWSATSTCSSLNDDREYDKLGFHINFDIPNNNYSQMVSVMLSKHSLERLVLRKKPNMIRYTEIIKYLNTVIKQFLLHCFAYIENYPHESKEFYANVDGLIYPIVFSTVKNAQDIKCLSFMIKTVMPVEFYGAKQIIKNMSDYKVKDNVTDYWPTLHMIADKLRV